MSDFFLEHLRELGDMRRTHEIEQTLSTRASPRNLQRLQMLKNRCSHQIDFYTERMAERPWAGVKTGADVLAMAAKYVELDEAGRTSYLRRIKPRLDDLSSRRRQYQLLQIELALRVLACELALRYRNQPDKFENVLDEMIDQMSTKWKRPDRARR